MSQLKESLFSWAVDAVQWLNKTTKPKLFNNGSKRSGESVTKYMKADAAKP
jgi:hypothetical protein